jgi:hypothetical protein
VHEEETYFKGEFGNIQGEMVEMGRKIVALVENSGILTYVLHLFFL